MITEYQRIIYIGNALYELEDDADNIIPYLSKTET